MSNDISGSENSAYWKQVNNKNKKEEKAANPDLLSELDTLFPSTVLTPKQEEQYNLYLKAIEKVEFSKQQKVIWDLFSLKCYTVTRIAKYLGLDKSTISKTLRAAIDKLKFECEKERVKQFSDNRDVAGFQKRLLIKGYAETDILFKERMENHKNEVESFYNEHPELKEGRRKKDEDPKS